MRENREGRWPVCIMVKPPTPGLAKTRLAEALGEVRAAELAAAFLRDTLALVQELPWAEPVLSTTDPRAPFFLSLVPRPAMWCQGDGDLGQRLTRTLSRGLEQATAAMVLAADSPGLPRAILEDARIALSDCDAVLGPATDGGFYLLGLRRLEPGLLNGLPWSSPSTCAATATRLRETGYRVAQLASFCDVDEPQDLERLEQELKHGRLHCPHTARALFGDMGVSS